MIRLYLDRSLCDDCGTCDGVYQGFRRVVEIMDESPLDIETWDAIEELATEAFEACPFEALYGDDDDL